MRVQCPECRKNYDDARCWTICPHMPLEGPVKPRSENPHGYCREHDLFACPLHEDSPGPTDAYGVCRAARAEDA